MALALFIGLGSSLGAITRYLISLLSRRYAPHIYIFHRKLKIPFGTILINTIGCYLIGVFSEFTITSKMAEYVHLSIIVGYLGGLTTYSTFGYESYVLLKERLYGTLLAYLLIQLVLAMVFVWLGILTTGAWS